MAGGAAIDFLELRLQTTDYGVLLLLPDPLLTTLMRGTDLQTNGECRICQVGRSALIIFIPFLSLELGSARGWIGEIEGGFRPLQWKGVIDPYYQSKF